MRRYSFLAWLLILLLAFFHSAAAQPTANEPFASVRAFTGRAIFTRPGQVTTLIPLDAGRVLASGRFTTLGGQPAPRSLAVITSGGGVDSSFRVDSSLVINEIFSAALQPDGKILIAGLFNKLPNTSTYYLLRLNDDGSLDSTFNDWSVNARVNTVLVDGNKILIGGNFSEPADHLARLDSNGSPDNTFNSLGTGPDGNIYAIARQSSGMYIIAGEFDSYNGADQAGLARLTANGSLDATFVPGGYKTSHHVAVLKDNSVVVGTEDSCGEDVFAWFTTNGDPRSTSGADPNLLQSITTLLPLPDGGFLVGGWHSSVCINGFPTSHEAQVWRFAAGGSYESMTSFADESDVYALANRSDGMVVVGGQGRPQTAAITGYFNGLALLDLAYHGLEKVSYFHPLVGDEAEIYSLSLYPNGKLLAAGNFTYVSGIPRPGLARLHPGGMLDTSFDPLADEDGGWSFSALALPDGRALVGFRDSNLYLLSEDGAMLVDLSAANNFDEVTTMALQTDGKILIGSSFGTGVRRLKADFSGMDEDFTTGVAQGPVYALAEKPDHKIVVAGGFTQYNGVNTSGLVQLYSNGGVVPDQNLPVFMLDEYSQATLYSVKPLADGSLLVGGNFTMVGNTERQALAMLSSTGSLVTEFAAPAELRTVKSICTTGDGNIWAGGIENTYLRQPLLMHLDTTGLDLTFQPVYLGAHDGGSINALLCANDSLLWSGGRFTLFDGRMAYGLVGHGIVRFNQYIPLAVQNQ